MKIGIIGIRGIPNQYGGFEQFTEFIAPMLVKKGHDVYVYNSSLHPYKESTWKGVNIISKYDPENKIGTAGQFIYDLNCILDARKRDYDIILQLGYTSSSIWSFLFPSKPRIVTNMDGLEWKRSKYSKKVQVFLQKAEKWAVKYSDLLIADSIGIQHYLQEKYQAPSTFISYGADVFESPEPLVPGEFELTPFHYNMLIARMEPENNIETILEGYSNSEITEPLILIGNYNNTPFGKRMFQTYQGKNIRFIGAVYDMQKLNNLRYYSNIYFHGHSVGGTNPSLLEAMASSCLILAHDNIFNRSVLHSNAYYFSDSSQLTTLLQKNIRKEDSKDLVRNNLHQIKNLHSWDYICLELEKLITHAHSGK